MTSERMPLARKMIHDNLLPKTTVLFDVQIAHDLIRTQGKFNPDNLGSVRPPYPDMFFEWDVSALPSNPFTPDDLDEDMIRLGITEEELLAQNELEITKVGCRMREGASNLLFRPYLIDDQDHVTDFGAGILVGVDEQGMATGRMSYQDLMGEDRPLRREYRCRIPEILRAIRPTVSAGTQVGLTALSLINCRNVTTEPLGEIRMRRSGAQKRRGVKPQNVRYNTIILPGGGSRKVGSGSGTHHRATAVHRVRGHFKHFGPDFGTDLLFGKLAGTYWWGWNIRGSVEQGEVVSDYKLSSDAH